MATVEDETVIIENLSEHALAMRQAWQHCHEVFLKWEASSFENVNGSCVSSLVLEAKEMIRQSTQQRQEAEQMFWQERQKKSTGIEVVDLSLEQSSSMNMVDFWKRFEYLNLPCLIRGLDHQDFESVTRNWRQAPADHRSSTRHKNTNKKLSSTILSNKDWFRQHVGTDTVVPVRYHQEPSEETACVDSQGRAEECQTIQMPLHQYLDLLEDSSSSRQSTAVIQEASSYYLKDWHLQSWLEQRQTISPLHYQVPPIFHHDLLNSFLTSFTSGDYRFVYWGPPGSITSRHSDVLNSFSWSYNVVGVKEWTFYPPSSAITFQPIVMRQNAGECIFVPSEWQHQVMNLQESLSINHNWITTANIDQSWKCIRSEMDRVDQELEAWKIDDMEARENMLRGCVGLDVTAFFLLLFTRLLELLASVDTQETSMVDSILVFWMDVMKISEALNGLINDDKVHLESRLQAILADQNYSCQALHCAKIVLSRLRLVLCAQAN